MWTYRLCLILNENHKISSLKETLVIESHGLTNELIYETETDSQTQRTDLELPREREFGERRTGSLGLADAGYYI